MERLQTPTRKENKNNAPLRTRNKNKNHREYIYVFLEILFQPESRRTKTK
jgi:hypothetical protein